MNYDGILFDLDGTLLPMDNDEFTKEYFKRLTKVGVKCGYDAETFQAAMWKGVGAMVKNDGSCRNEGRFWSTVSGLLGPEICGYGPVFDTFYDNEFHETKTFTRPNPLARKAVELAREKAGKVVLATNPLFPTNAVYARMSWIGLRPEDFDWITDYTNSSTCKPNPAYYKEITDKLDLDLQRCIMIGNHVQEDMEAAAAAGMPGFWVTDWPINHGQEPECPKGSFEELIGYLQSL